jgi:WXG100 family type VII secretion target
MSTGIAKRPLTWGHAVMAEPFSVDPEALSDALDRMDGFQKLSEALMGEIEGLVKALHVTWQGSGASEHAQAHQQWAHGASLMRDALTTLHRAGAGAHHNYTQAMSANQKMWS